jgi:hypothetical protein
VTPWVELEAPAETTGTVSIPVMATAKPIAVNTPFRMVPSPIE